ncbi:lectin subunit alpha-like [Lucilia sericata]|uniref:lectin subunit alpha-like n=1 Tax=Lucilia sericata TaxID=13632 RepID=UPI0018A87E1D|nr:lectin subunit alpha-like [Lucilia sericata]
MQRKIYINILIVFIIFLITSESHKMYFIENAKFLDWDDANKACKAKGMDLLTIENKEELDYLKQYINETYGRLFPYWLGAYRTNGQFFWTATGEKIKEFFWHKGQPDDKSGHENCIHTWEGYFDWNDNDCERELPFICDLNV